MTLRLAPGLELPDEAVTQTFGILAKRGSGKSNTGAVMAEEMFRAGLPFVAVDPVGAWWGLRSSSDGKDAGLPIPIFGGHRGDVPLEAQGAELIADLIVDERLSCVLDVSAFESEGAKRRFLSAFAERLFRRKGQPGHDDPLHLFLEEADDYAPQRAGGVEVNRTLGAFQRIVKQGRARGLGSTMITQRSAVLNKDLLTQIETLMVMRTTAPNDRKAIEGWVTYHAQSVELLASLHELKDGEAWVWSPWLGVTKRVQVRRRETFDSGATPSVRTKVKRAPATLADIDLGSIRDRMAATIEKAKAEDPRELTKRIRELERELATERTKPTAAAEPVVERVEVPAVPQDVVDTLAKLVDAAGDVYSAALALDEQGTSLGFAVEKLRKIEDWANARGAGTGTPRAASRDRTGPSSVSTAVGARSPRPVKPASSSSTSSEATESEAGSLSGLDKSARSILSVLAQFPDGRTHDQLALLTGYSAKASTIGVALSKLRRFGFATDGQPVKITNAGASAIGNSYEPLPTGPALLEHWRRHKSMDKAARAVLDVLIDVYPQATSQQEVAERTGYSPDASTIGVAMSRLRRLEIADGWKASDDFMEAIR